MKIKKYFLRLLILFILANVPSCYGYVTHFQSQILNISDTDKWDENAETLTTIDILRCSALGFEPEIAKGHNCGGTTCYGYSHQFKSHTAINFYSNIRVSDRGYVLKEGDTYCKGDKLTRSDSNSGEWFTKGGASDSPPIQWMSCEELKDTLTYLVEWHPKNVYPKTSKLDLNKSPDSYIVDNDAINRDDIISYGGTFSIYSHLETTYPAYISLLCCDKNEDDEKDTFQIKTEPICFLYMDSYMPEYTEYNKNGNIKYSEYIPQYKPLIFVQGASPWNVRCCLLPISCGNAKYFENLTWIDQYFEKPLASINYNLNLTEVDPAVAGRGPDIAVVESFYQDSAYQDEPLYIRFVVENQGDMVAHIDGVSVNADDFEVIFSPDEIEAGESAEIVIRVSGADTSGLELDIDYFADEVGCLPTKDFSEPLSIGKIELKDMPACSVDDDCPDTGVLDNVCCNGKCYDPGRGSCDDFNGDGMFEWGYY